MGSIKALGQNEQEKQTKQSTTPRDQMLHIMRTIWSSRTDDQLKACRNMIKTFERANGTENFGSTLMEIEMERQKRLNQLFKNMGNVQTALDKQNKEKKEQANKVNPKMLLSKEELKKENKKKTKGKNKK
tara:strand:+ start:2269 stop:2658 length:390 start_codon:yes stop_codon:yes gene_type:complete